MLSLFGLFEFGIVFYSTEVTKIMLYAAQSTHDTVPPEIIETLIRCIVNNFVTERNSSDVMAIG